METRANYAAIGSAVLGLVLAGVLFLLWLTNAGEQAKRVQMRVIFNGAVSGLSTGSAVQFNGIRIGEVKSLLLDDRDPNTVIALLSVDRTAPIRTDTRAVLAYQGFTGISNLQLEGGSRNAPLLIESVDPEDGLPTIQGEVSPFQDILESARNVLSRADSAMAAIDDFVTDNGPAFGRTVANIETFSKALAENSEGVGDLLANVSAMAKTVGEVSVSLRGSAEQLEAILGAVDPAEVRVIVADFRASSERLQSLMERADAIAQGIDPAEIDAALKNVTEAAASLDALIAGARDVVAAVDPEKVAGILDSVRGTSDRLSNLTEDADRLLAAVDTGKVGSIVDQIDTATRALADASTAVGPVVVTARDTLQDIGAVVGAVEPAKVRSVVDDVSAFTGRLSATGEGIDRILADVEGASQSLARLGQTIDRRQPDIDQIVSNARQLSEQLNGVAARADGILQKVDGYVEGDGEGLVTEATAAMTSIRKVADTLDRQIGPITSNIADFSGRGLSGLSQLIAEGQSALARLNRVLAGVERDPQQFIFGNEGVPEYAPRRR
jgi:ABC-type transport system involved in resistance to organic solvents, periplasmic component